MNKEALLAGLMFGGGGGNGLPTIESGDAGKVLKVNAGETGTEWGEAGGGNIYKHTITWHHRKGYGQQYAGQGGIITIQVYSTKSTAYTWSSLRTAFGTKTIQATGIFYNSDKSIRYNIFSVRVNASNPRFDAVSYLQTTISDNTEVFVYNNYIDLSHSSVDEFNDSVILMP